MAGFVGKWKHVGTDFLEVDADLISRDFAPDRAVVWTLVVDLEAEALDVEGDRGLQVLHDEVWCNRNEVSGRPFAGRAILGILGHGSALIQMAEGDRRGPACGLSAPILVPRVHP